MGVLKKPVFVLFCFFFFSSALGASPETASCSVCGMEIKVDSKIGFEADFQGKHIHFCSFSCALRFHQKHTDVSLLGHDYISGTPLDTKESFFLVKSPNLLKELEFGMPPAVAVFSSESSAKKAQARLGDGQVAKGLEQAAQAFQ